MGEAIVYRLNNMMEYVMFCLAVSAVVGFFFFYITKEEKFSNKQVKLYGLLINLNKIDVLMLSVAYMKMVAIIYYAFNLKADILEFLVIYLILGAMFLAYNYKHIISEVVNTISSGLVLYLINILNNYQIEVETNIYVSSIKITLITFICLYAIYMFLNNLEDIVNKNKSIRRNANEKK